MQQAALSHSLNRVHILVIENSLGIRLLLRLRLQQAGYAVDEAGNKEQARDFLLRGGQIHLILLDLLQPDRNDFATAEELQRLSKAPIIVLSTQTDTQTKVEALNHYADDYVTKPFVFPELLARIRRVLARHGMKLAGRV